MGISHHAQGRGGSHYKVDLQDIVTQSKATERFNAGASIEIAELEEKKLAMMYALDGQTHLIDQETFEQHTLPVDLYESGEACIPFLKEGMLLRVQYHKEAPVLVKTPDRAVFSIAETLPVSSGSQQSKGTIYKSATLENGAVVRVPEFLAQGDNIIVDLNEFKYVGKASKEDMN